MQHIGSLRSLKVALFLCDESWWSQSKKSILESGRSRSQEKLLKWWDGRVRPLVLRTGQAPQHESIFNSLSP